MSQTSNKVKTMFELVFDIEKETDKREQGAANLIVLAKERSGAELLLKEGAIPKIARLMKVEKDIKIRLNLIRCIGQLCQKGQEFVKEVLKECGVPFFLDILNTKNEEVVNASSYVIQVSCTQCSEIRKKVVSCRMQFHEIFVVTKNKVI